ncbi:MAG: AbrB/MazE/SpoVT family DNA-binding domain-containing protein [Acidobacteria bacterium]|nr:AbrB/MazE/SpoVT family DNA-binding domain-containing protein [Acidobacteriota bacterium]
METTIDAAGRVVIPKAIRDRLGLKSGTPLRIEAIDGRVEIEAVCDEPHLEWRDGLLVAIANPATPPLSPADVEEALTSLRDERLTEILDAK